MTGRVDELDFAIDLPRHRYGWVGTGLREAGDWCHGVWVAVVASHLLPDRWTRLPCGLYGSSSPPPSGTPTVTHPGAGPQWQRVMLPLLHHPPPPPPPSPAARPPPPPRSRSDRASHSGGLRREQPAALGATAAPAQADAQRQAALRGHGGGGCRHWWRQWSRGGRRRLEAGRRAKGTTPQLEQIGPGQGQWHCPGPVTSRCELTFGGCAEALRGSLRRLAESYGEG